MGCRDIGLPATVDEDLSTKPKVQQQFLALTNAGLGRLDEEQRRNYINFYGNLMKSSAKYLVRILEILEEQGLLDNTLVIHMSDHGEMGMAHGGQRQKNFNFYEESLRAPLICSNPKLFPGPVESDAMVSHHIVSIREDRYKLAKYYNVEHPEGPYEWEMYDLADDPLETKNLAYSGYKRLRPNKPNSSACNRNSPGSNKCACSATHDCLHRPLVSRSTTVCAALETRSSRGPVLPHE
jgi:arylsulfatase A-like enzyme